MFLPKLEVLDVLGHVSLRARRWPLPAGMGSDQRHVLAKGNQLILAQIIKAALALCVEVSCRTDSGLV